MMGRYVVLILFAFLVEGVFGDAAEVKSVNDGDFVILNIYGNKGPDDMVRWYFNDSLIALINGDPKKSCLYDGEDGRFRDRLMLDCKTGSLIITDITTQHAERYIAELKRERRSGKTEKLNRDLKCDRTNISPKNRTLGEIIKSISLTVSASKADKNKKEPQNVPQDQTIGKNEVKSVMEGDPVILNTGVTKQQNYTVRWYFNGNLKAVIDGICCLYDGEDGKFRNRLMLDCKTGSLIITDTRAAHAGHYEAKRKRDDPLDKTEKLNRTAKCESARIIPKNGNPEEIIKSISLTVSGSGLSPAAVAGICVGIVGVVLLVAAAVGGVVKFTHCSIFDKKKNKQVPEQVSEKKSFLQTQNGNV